MLKSSSPQFFSKLDISKKVLSKINQADLQKVSDCILEDRYYQNGLCLEKIGEVDGITISSIRLSLDRRALTLSVEAAMVIVKYLPKHIYPTQEDLKSFCRTVLEKYHNEFDRYFENIALDQRSCDNPQSIPTSHFVIEHNTSKIALDEQQTQVCYSTLPVKVQGCPGAGKSLIGLFMIKDQSYGHIAYYSRSPFLVQKQKELFEEEFRTEDEEKKVYFFSSNDLYPKGKTHQNHDILHWIEYILKNQIRALEHHNLIHLIQELQTLYVLKQLFPDSFYDHYKNRFVRPSFYTPDQVQSIHDLFAAFIERFLNDENKPYVEGFVCCDPSPGQPMNKMIIDENQECTVAENFFFFTKTENAQLVFLRDTKQSQNWQGIDALSVFENIWYKWLESENKSPIKIQTVTLSKSYRNSQAVTKLANRMLRLKNLWLEGTVLKDESPLFEESPIPTGQVRLYSSIESPEYEAIKPHLPENSTQWAIVTQECYKEEARALFGDNVLIFSNQEVPGLEFTTVIRYKATNREVLALQNGKILKEFLSDNEKRLFLKKSPILERSTALIQSVGCDITVTTRARDLVLVIEPPVEPKDFDTPKKARIVQNALSYLYPEEEYSDHQAPWIVNMRASSFEEWVAFIRQLWNQGVTREAERLFEIHLQPTLGIKIMDWIDPLLIKKDFAEDQVSEIIVNDHRCAKNDENNQESGLTSCSEKTKTKSTSKKTVLDKGPTQSPQFLGGQIYKNIKNIVQSKDFNTKLIRIDSQEDLIDILYSHAIVLQNDPKNPIGCVQNGSQKEIFSFYTGFIQGNEKAKQTIRVKIEKLFNLSNTRKKMHHISFFDQPCPDSLLQFLRSNSIEEPHEMRSLGEAIFWSVVYFPECYDLFELKFGNRTRGTVTLNLEAKNTLEELYKRWLDTVRLDIKKIHKQSQGYALLSHFLYTQIGCFLNWEPKDAEDLGPNAALYRLITSNPYGAEKNKKRAALHDMMSSVSSEDVLRYLTYRSEVKNLNILETLKQNLDFESLCMLLEEVVSLSQKGALFSPDIFYELSDLLDFQEATDLLNLEKSNPTAYKKIIETPGSHGAHTAKIKEHCLHIKRINLCLWDLAAVRMDMMPISLSFLALTNLTIEQIEKYLNQIFPYLKQVSQAENEYRANALQKQHILIGLDINKSEYSLFRFLVSNRLHTHLVHFLNAGLKPIVSNSKEHAEIEMYWNIKKIFAHELPKEIVSIVLDDFKSKVPNFKIKLKEMFLTTLFFSQMTNLRTNALSHTLDMLEVLFYEGISILDTLDCDGELLSCFQRRGGIFAWESRVSQDNHRTAVVSLPIAYFILDSENPKLLEFASDHLKNALVTAYNNQQDRSDAEFMRHYFGISLSSYYDESQSSEDTLFSWAVRNNRPYLAEMLLDLNPDVRSHRINLAPPLYGIVDHIVKNRPGKDIWLKIFKRVFCYLESSCIEYPFIFDHQSLFAQLLIHNHGDIALELLQSKYVFRLANHLRMPFVMSQVQKGVSLLSKVNPSSFLSLLEKMTAICKESDLMVLLNKDNWHEQLCSDYLSSLLSRVKTPHFLQHNLAEAIKITAIAPTIVLGKNSRSLLDHEEIWCRTLLISILFRSESQILLRSQSQNYTPSTIEESFAIIVCETLETLGLSGSALLKYINYEDNQKNALFLAMQAGFFNLVKKLILMGSSINVPKEYGSLLLLAVARHAPVKILERILIKEAQLYEQSPEQYMQQHIHTNLSRDEVNTIFHMQDYMSFAPIQGVHSGNISYFGVAIICNNAKAMNFFIHNGYQPACWSDYLIMCAERNHKDCVDQFKNIVDKVYTITYKAVINTYSDRYQCVPIEYALSSYLQSRTVFMKEIALAWMMEGAHLTIKCHEILSKIEDEEFKIIINRYEKRHTALNSSGLHTSLPLLFGAGKEDCSSEEESEEISKKSSPLRRNINSK